MPAPSKEFLDIQVTIESGFTLKRVRDMIRTYSQYFLGSEKRSGKSIRGELKILKTSSFRISISNWKVCFASANYFKRGITCANWIYERCFFFSSTKSVVKELYSVFMFMESLKFLCFWFGLRPAPGIFTKLIKIPQCLS